MADIGSPGQPRFDHPPTDRALQPAKREQREQPKAVTRRNRAAKRKPKKRERKGEADQSTEQPVHPFPEKDKLECGKAHAPIYFKIFRRRLIFGERIGPGGIANRGQRARNRFPLGNRKARLGKPGNSTDDNHGEHQKRNGEQPVGNGVGTFESQHNKARYERIAAAAQSRIDHSSGGDAHKVCRLLRWSLLLAGRSKKAQIYRHPHHKQSIHL